MADKPMRCLLELMALPVEAYRLPEDGRRWQQVAHSRRTLCLELASHANPDGTEIWPSVETMCKRTGFSRRLVEYRLDELAELGFLVNGKQRGRDGPRNRALNMAKIQAAKQCTEGEINSALTAETVHRSDETMHRKADKQCTEGAKQCNLDCTLPPTLPPEQTAPLPPPAGAGDGWPVFQKLIEAHDVLAKAPMPKAVEKWLRKLVAQYGPHVAADTARRWIRQRDLTGYRQTPWVPFQKEFQPFLREALNDTPESRQACEDAAIALARQNNPAAFDPNWNGGAPQEESPEETARKLRELAK